MNKGITTYSERFLGDSNNHQFAVRFDVTDGYVGVTQFSGERVNDRVLLSPAQLDALTRFVRARPRRAR